MFRFPAHSLYWRIAIGFIVSVGIILAIQLAVLLWMVSRADPDLRGSFTLPLAHDIEQQLIRNPSTDVDQYVRSHHADPPRSFYVIMTDHTVVMVGPEAPRPGDVAGVIREFDRPPPQATIPRSWEVSPYWASPILID